MSYSFSEVYSALLDVIQPPSFAAAQAQPLLRTVAHGHKVDGKRLAQLFDRWKGTQGSKMATAEKRQLYIANQISYEGFDELQRLYLAQELGIHSALDGPPGVGKTQCVQEMSRVLQRPLYTRNCSSKTSENHIIAYPSLRVSDGASETVYVDGPLTTAMGQGAIFYGDEFNLLKEDVQKRLNSAFDGRRTVDKPDGTIVGGEDGFWAVISYNPSQGLLSRDLEDSVADRFIHLHFERWSPDFKAFVALQRAAGTKPEDLQVHNDLGLDFHWRGIGRDGTMVRGLDGAQGLRWMNFFTGGPASEPEYRYLVLDSSSILAKTQGFLPGKTGDEGRETLENLAEGSFSRTNFARMLARFTHTMVNLSNSGQSPLLQSLGMGDLKEKEDLELFSLHESSARIEIAALSHYDALIGRGCNRYLAQSYAVRLVIDQLCYGQYRNRKLREDTVYGLTYKIAKAMGLVAEDRKYNTAFLESKLLGPASRIDGQ